MDVIFNKVAPNPFNNNTPTAGFEAHTVIKRSDFGMKAAIPNIGFASPQDVATGRREPLGQVCI